MSASAVVMYSGKFQGVNIKAFLACLCHYLHARACFISMMFDDPSKQKFGTPQEFNLLRKTFE